ncbi:hypothetical protein EHS25_009750 [Saitozyma podzolica]|uniref:Pali-domain-containing protein n=1 Tax=Saitozyma podzolica TaxID=1890683 RepID=A0A427YK59_9TREE|nr:hypothetical protein EHS25_009750 [Saitozyma podzolica]
MAPSPVYMSLFFCFAAMSLLVFASVSPPAWSKVNFLDAYVNGAHTYFGVFGECLSGGSCTTKSVGYNLSILNDPSLNIGSTALNRLTSALILHPIAGGLALFAFIFGILGIAFASRFATVLMGLFATLGAFTALVIFVIDMVLWNITKNEVSSAGGSATLGNANWLTVGATVALFLAMCTSFCGACGRFATGRAAGEKY